MTQMMIKSPAPEEGCLFPGSGVIWGDSAIVIRGRLNHTTSISNDCNIHADDDGEGGTDALFAIDSSISGFPFRKLFYPWAEDQPIDFSMFWIRFVQVSRGIEIPIVIRNLDPAWDDVVYDTPFRMDTVLSAGDKILVSQDATVTTSPIWGYSSMQCASSEFYIDICPACLVGDEPDGNWERRRVILLSTGSGALAQLMFWGGSTLWAEDNGPNPRPSIKFLPNDGVGPSLVQYTDNGVTSFKEWYEDPIPSSQTGQYEIGQWGTASGDFPTEGDVGDVLSEDQFGSFYAMNNSDYDDEHELLDAEYYFDFSSDPIGTTKMAAFYIYVMDNTEAWAEVSRLVVLKGTKTA